MTSMELRIILGKIIDSISERRKILILLTYLTYSLEIMVVVCIVKGGSLHTITIIKDIIKWKGINGNNFFHYYSCYS